MRKAPWLGVRLGIVIALLSCRARVAEACGGCFVPAPPPTAPSETVDSAITAERMIFSISPEETTLYDEITFSGSPSSFAWVLPIRGEVKVGLSADVLFATLDQLTAVSVNAPPLDCPPPPVCSTPSYGGGGCSGCAGASITLGNPFTFGASLGLPATCSGDEYYLLTTACGSCPADSSYAVCSGGVWADCDCSIPSGYTAYGGGDAAVTVTARQQVGPYEMVELRSKDGSALTTWLDSHGYKVGSADGPVIAHYVAQGMDFLALKLVPGAGVNEMQPVRVTTPGAFPVLPLRMVGVGAGATTGITLWVVADGRWEPQDFPFFTITSSELAWDWSTSRSNYEELRQSKESALHGAGWLIESSLELSKYTISNSLQQSIEYDFDGGGGYLPPPAVDGGGDGSDDGANPSDGGSPETAPIDASSETGEAGVAEGGPQDAGAEADEGDAGGDADADPRAAAEQDLSVLFAGISGANVRVTRMRADLAHAALADDLVISASTDQGELPNTLKTTKQIGQPLCPTYDSNCNPTGEVSRDQAEASANGGCRTMTRRSPWGSRAALSMIGAIGCLGILRKRRRKLSRG
jgi:hypothetical protein